MVLEGLQVTGVVGLVGLGVTGVKKPRFNPGGFPANSRAAWVVGTKNSFSLSVCFLQRSQVVRCEDKAEGPTCGDDDCQEHHHT